MQKVWATPLLATVGALACWLVWLAIGAVHQHRVIDDDVLTVLAEDGKVDIVVEIGFTPERFHASFFREIAPVGGRTKGQSFYLRGLDRQQLGRVARQLWVDSVKPWQRES